jgi:hypothetical protein
VRASRAKKGSRGGRPLNFNATRLPEQVERDGDAAPLLTHRDVDGLVDDAAGGDRLDCNWACSTWRRVRASAAVHYSANASAWLPVERATLAGVQVKRSDRPPVDDQRTGQRGDHAVGHCGRPVAVPTCRVWSQEIRDGLLSAHR